MATTPLQAINLPPVPSAMDIVGDGKIVSQPWQQWFVNVENKVNAINAVIVAISGSGSTSGAFNTISPLTTKGDLIVYNGTSNVRFPVGANGYTIVADSTQPDGMKWVPGGSGGNPINIVNNSLTSYTIQLVDVPAASSSTAWIASSNASTNYIQIDTHTNQAIPVGAHIYVSEEGNGQTIIKALSGVTFVGPTITAIAKGVGELVQIAINTWHVFGNLAYQIYMNYATVILADTPLAYWHLGESTGTTAADSSGNSYNGTYTGTYLQGQTSILPSGYGASFNTQGTGYVLLPSTAGLSGIATPLSLECWVYLTAIPSALKVLLDVGGSGSPQMSISAVTTGKIRFSFSALVNASAESSGSVAVNTKTHIVITVTSGGAIIYYLQGVASGTATITTHTGSGAGRIGDYYAGGYIIPGLMQEVAIYNYVLTPTQVSNHYAAG